MPRKKKTIPEHIQRKNVNCFAFRRTKDGKPMCAALDAVYCMLEPRPCRFKATPEAAAKAYQKAHLRLERIGWTGRRDGV